MKVKRVYLLYSLSGFVSLGYQVAWFGIYVDRLGSGAVTFALVLCNFIAGLGAGALASRRVSQRLGRTFRLRDPLRVYGLVELLVTAAALLTVLAGLIGPDIWGRFPYVLRDGIYGPAPLYQAAKLSIASVCLFVPCFFMGVTFPLLCRAFGDDGRFPSALYAWNTLGACAGVLVCQFALLPRLGHDTTLWLMAGVNALIGVTFLAWPRGDTSPRIAEPGAGADGDTARGSVAVNAGIAVGADASALLTCAVLGGLLAGALEGDLFKRLWFLGGTSTAAMSFISFWAILAIFAGSATVRALPRLRLLHIKVALVLAVLCYLAAWQFAYPIRRWLSGSDIAAAIDALGGDSLAPRSITVRFGTSMTQLLVFAGVFAFPAMYLISLLLPYVCNRLQSRHRHLGVAYGLNTLAFCAGVIAFTWLLPAVSVFYSLKLVMAVLAIGAALAATLTEGRPLRAWQPAAAVGCVALVATFTPAEFDRAYVNPDSAAARYPVSAMRASASHTIYVVADPAGRRLYFDNHTMSGTGASAQMYMRLMAHFPLLVHRHPQRALLIGFGVGNTASAIAAHDSIQQIDVVELNRQVFDLAPEFADSNGRVDLDPRLRLIHDDGRNFLNLTDQTYDLITSEPPPPMQAGVFRLYTHQYYRQVLAHLTPQGMMTQWLPLYQMSPQAADLVLATFVNVFPHALLFSGYDRELIMLGSASPIDLGVLEQRFGQSRRATDDLRRLNVTQPLALVARVVQGDATLRRRYLGRPTISDQRNELANLLTDPRRLAVIAYDPLAVLAEVDADHLAMRDALRRTVLHFGRLKYQAPDFPIESLVTVRQAGGAAASTVALADVDWVTYDRLMRRYASAKAADQPDVALPLLQRALALSPQQPRVLLELGGLHYAMRRYDEALDALKRFQTLEPNDAAGYLGLASVYLAMKRLDESLATAGRAVQLAPNDPRGHKLQGDALSALGRWPQAVEAYDRALALTPDDHATRRRRVRAYDHINRP